MTDGDATAAPEHDEAGLTSGDLDAGDGAVSAFFRMACGSEAQRAERSERDGAGDGRRIRHAGRAHGAAEGLRRGAASSSTPISKAPRGAQLAANPKAALLFHWKSLRRQVRVRGPVEPVTTAEADAYFRTRPRLCADRRLGEPASRRRSKAASRSKRRSRAIPRNIVVGKDVPRPPHWSGFRITPQRDRVLARRRLPPAPPRCASPATRRGGWAKTMLYP